MNKESEAKQRRVDVNSPGVLWYFSRVMRGLLSDVEFGNDWEPELINCVEYSETVAVLNRAIICVHRS